MTGIWHRFRRSPQAELSCVELVELVTDYLEGALAEPERDRFDAHLQECPGCTNYVEQIRLTIAIVGKIQPDDLSESAKSELLAAFRGWARD